jgi:hypothetical protein
MIKIQLHLHEDSNESVKLITKLVDDHWNFLNQTLARKPHALKKYALISKCRQSILDLAGDTYLKVHELKKSDGKKIIAFLTAILDDGEKLLREIVMSPPKELSSLVVKIKTMLPDDFLYTPVKSGDAQTKAGRYLSEVIFDYGNFRASKHCSKTFREGMNSNLLTCPYCNLNRIVVTDISDSVDDTQDAYLDLDHFFPKSRYPYFAVSFYNLVPCCHDCNSKLKGAKEYGLDTHIHPYLDSFDDFYAFRLNAADYISGKITIEGHLRKGMRNDASMTDLDLIKRYKANIVQVADVVNYYKSRMRKIESDPAEHVDVFAAHFSFKKNEILHRPQSKLLRDIVSQIDVTNSLEILEPKRVGGP